MDLKVGEVKDAGVESVPSNPAPVKQEAPTDTRMEGQSTKNDAMASSKAEVSAAASTATTTSVTEQDKFVDERNHPMAGWFFRERANPYFLSEEVKTSPFQFCVQMHSEVGFSLPQCLDLLQRLNQVAPKDRPAVISEAIRARLQTEEGCKHLREQIRKAQKATPVLAFSSSDFLGESVQIMNAIKTGKRKPPMVSRISRKRQKNSSGASAQSGKRQMVSSAKSEVEAAPIAAQPTSRTSNGFVPMTRAPGATYATTAADEKLGAPAPAPASAPSATHNSSPAAQTHPSQVTSNPQASSVPSTTSTSIPATPSTTIPSMKNHECSNFTRASSSPATFSTVAGSSEPEPEASGAPGGSRALENQTRSSDTSIHPAGTPVQASLNSPTPSSDGTKTHTAAAAATVSSTENASSAHETSSILPNPPPLEAADHLADQATGEADAKGRAQDTGTEPKSQPQTQTQPCPQTQVQMQSQSQSQGGRPDAANLTHHQNPSENENEKIASLPPQGLSATKPTAMEIERSTS